MRTRHLIVAAALTLLATLAWGADGDAVRWLNMHVTDRGEDAEVQLHVPLSLVLTVLDAVDTSTIHAGRVRLNHDGDCVDWVAILDELKRSPDGQVVNVHQPDVDVRLVRHDGTVSLDVDECGGHKEHVEVRLSAGLLEAFRVDEHNRLDVKALLTGLSAVAPGELLHVDSPDANVRIWVE